ncbi:MAG TPA: GNAT family N-acetyltransferase [Vicinamibacterales bacterium]|jgi:CelD/BcsL family acetyltransferase involved in cellulose biosynthesis
MVSTQSTAWTKWEDVRESWRALFLASPYRSFFTSVEWIDTWLAVFGEQLNPEIVTISDGERVIGACLLVYRDEKVAFVPVRRVYLNTSGEDERDETYIEFNDLLCLDACEQVVAQALGRHLQSAGWDELILNGCNRSGSIDALLDVFQDLSRTGRIDRSFYVSLDPIRDAGRSVEAVLSRNSRRNVKRTTTAYQQLGALTFEVAEQADTALRMLDQLAALHQSRWVAKGEAGVFSSARFVQFNRTLVERHLRDGRVQMMRLSVGDRVIGVICNLVLDRKVYFYLCGFELGTDNNLRPGLITVHRAIQYCLEHGFGEFDLMAGDVQYKRTFSEVSRELHWITLRRPSAKLRMLETLRTVRASWTRGESRTPSERDDENAV